MKQHPRPAEVDRNIRNWVCAMQASHELLMAGLRRKVGPDGDVRQAYRDWIAQVRQERDQRYRTKPVHHAGRLICSLLVRYG